MGHLVDRDTAVARIQRGLGFRTDQNDNIVLALREAKRLLERGRTLPKFLLQEDQTLSILAGDADVSMPDGFIREKEGEGPHYISAETGKPVFLEKVTLEEGLLRFSTVDAGRPVAYTIRKNSLKFYPERDIAYDLTWSYYKQSVSLATNVSNNEWLDEENGSPEALYGKAGMAVALDMRNKTAYDLFKELFLEGWQTAFAEGIEDEDTNDPIIVGGRN